jgi:SnoaL-like domain
MELAFADGPTRGSWRGLAAVAKAWREFLRTWESYRIEPEEYRELDRERVLVLVRFHGRGKTSGVDLGGVGSSGANLFYVRDGKVKRLLSYAQREQAFADLGLKS